MTPVVLTVRRPGSGQDQPSSPSDTPWLAVTAFIVSLVSIGGVLTILFFSDGRETGTWIPGAGPVQPSVLLAILSGIFNAAQVFALSEGLAVLWWHSATSGASLKTLHCIWSKGNWTAFNANPQVLWVMVVTILTVITSVASNPLLQRSLHTSINDRRSQVERYWFVRATIPDGWVGTVDPRAPAGLTADSGLAQLAQDWYEGKRIESILPDLCQEDICEDEYRSRVKAAGIAINCTSSRKSIDLSAPENEKATLFNVSFTRHDDSDRVPMLLMKVLSISEVDSSCVATINEDHCEIRSAEVRYDLSFYIDGFTIQSTPEVVSMKPSVGDSASAKRGLAAGPLAGLGWVGHYYLRAEAALVRDNQEYYTEPMGITALQYSNYDAGTFSNLGDCVFEWRNATDDLVYLMHELMVRMAVASANASSDQATTVETVKHNDLVQYRSDYLFMWIAVGIMIGTSFGTFSLLWQYWGISKPVTLSPLETAFALRNIWEQGEVVNIDQGTASELVARFGHVEVEHVGVTASGVGRPGTSINSTISGG